MAQMKLFKLICFLSFILLFSQCSNKDNEDFGLSNLTLDNIEGMYVGTFTNEFYNKTYERQGTSYTGNVTIKKLAEGIYAFDIICEDYGLNIRIEDVRISSNDGNDIFSIHPVSFSENLPWSIYGTISPNWGFSISLTHSINGEHYDTYHCTNGYKVK